MNENADPRKNALQDQHDRLRRQVGMDSTPKPPALPTPRTRTRIAWICIIAVVVIAAVLCVLVVI